VGYPHKLVRTYELPAYTLSEAAHYLSVPVATIRYWSRGQSTYPALISSPPTTPALLSFFNLTELHMLAAIRRQHEIPMQKVRAAIDYLVKNNHGTWNKKHPLISKNLETDGIDLFVRRYGDLANISMDGQMAMKEILQAALQRIERNPHGIPIKLFPFTRTDVTDAPEMVVIDPALSGGRPVIAGTGLATEIIAERYKAGESMWELSHDYGRSNEEIEEAIRCELPTAA